MFVKGVAIIRVADTTLTLESGVETGQGKVIVLKNTQIEVPVINTEPGMHHIDDAVCQAVIFAKAVTSISFNIDNGLTLAKRIGKTFTDNAEINFQGNLAA